MTAKREDRKMAANENAAAFLARLKTSFNDSGRNVRLLNTLDKLITGANHKHLKARLAKSIIFTKGAEDQMSYANIRGMYDYTITKSGPYTYMVVTKHPGMNFITKEWLELLGFHITNINGNRIVIEEASKSSTSRIMSEAYKNVLAELLQAKSNIERYMVDIDNLTRKMKVEEKRLEDLEVMLASETQLEEYVLRVLRSA